MKIISGILILITVYLNAKHAWAGFSGKVSPAEAEMFSNIGITGIFIPAISILSLAIAGLVLFPQTFFIGNLLNATVILIIMALSLNAGVWKIALMEIPFFIMPLVMIWLGHPLRNTGL